MKDLAEALPHWQTAKCRAHSIQDKQDTGDVPACPKGQGWARLDNITIRFEPCTLNAM